MKSAWTDESFAKAHSAIERKLAKSPRKRRTTTKPKANHGPLDKIDQAVLDALASLTMADVPALEELLVLELVEAISKIQHDGPATAHDGGMMVMQLHRALVGCRGSKPERQPTVTDGMDAYRNALVAGAHSFAPHGKEGLLGLLAKGMAASKGELDKGRGDMDSQLRGVYQWLILALVSGYDSSSPNRSTVPGILAAFTGWSEILRGESPSFFQARA